MPESNALAQKLPADPGDSTPEDVATLYSWANLHGAKYRDFSASRALAREESRLRVEEAIAEQKRLEEEEAERKRQEEAQLAARLAAEAAEAARQAEEERLAEIARQAELERQAVVAAQEAQRQAALQRSWQPPPDPFSDIFPSPLEPENAQARAMASNAHPAGFEPEERFIAPSYWGGPGESGPGDSSLGQSGRGESRPGESRLVESRPAQKSSAQPRPGQSSAPGSADATLFRTEAATVAAQAQGQPYSHSFEQGSSGRTQAYPEYPEARNAPGQAPATRSPGVYSSASPQANSVPAGQPSSHPRYPGAPFAANSPAPGYSGSGYSVPPEPFAPSLWQPQELPHDLKDARDPREQSARPAWLAPELSAPNSGAAQRQSANPSSGQPGSPAPSPVSYSGSYPGSYSGSYSASYPVPSGQPAYSGSYPLATPYPAANPSPAFAPSYAPHAPQAASLPAGTMANQAGGQNPYLNSGPVDDTLLGSRDRIANRWYALKSVLDPQAAQTEAAPAPPPARVPVLAVFSLAGGVGKTSLVASLGRALSSRGERVLLVDTAAYGLLPFFFGARDQRPGLLRTFNPPGSSAEAPIQLVTLDPDGQTPEFQGASFPSDRALTQAAEAGQPASSSANPGGQDWLAQEVGRYGRASSRVIIDLPTASGSTTRRILRLGPTILVPVAPDMNSVVSVGAIEAFFRNGAAGAGAGAPGQNAPILPYYVLNQFDYSLPLHLDVREILHEQIGDRLLPFALRRSPAVSEALAEGMTVMDYAPNAVVAEDYAHLAGWVRSIAAPATQSHRGVRWSER